MSESAGRKRNVHSVFPLHGKAQAYTPPVGENFGRGLLASSHAGTRLPIAVFLARAQGAPPLPAPVKPGRRRFSPLHILSSKKWKTARPQGLAVFASRCPYGGITHIRSKGRSVRSLSAGRLPCFPPNIIAFSPKIVKRACKGRERSV